MPVGISGKLLNEFDAGGFLFPEGAQGAGEKRIGTLFLAVLRRFIAFAPDTVFIAVDLAVIFFVGNDDVALFVEDADAVGNGINQGLEE